MDSAVKTTIQGSTVETVPNRSSTEYHNTTGQVTNVSICSQYVWQKDVTSTIILMATLQRKNNRERKGEDSKGVDCKYKGYDVLYS